MKILIISLPRTGSTSYNKIISEKYNLNMIHEPFNEIFYKDYKDYDWDNNDDYVVKSIIDQLPKGESDIISYWKEFYKKFDKTILLSRKDLIGCAESLSYASYYDDKGYWEKKYIWEPTPNFNIVYKWVVHLNNLINELNDLLKLDIIYYEDIFDINSDERLRINKKRVKII